MQTYADISNDKLSSCAMRWGSATKVLAKHGPTYYGILE